MRALVACVALVGCAGVDPPAVVTHGIVGGKIAGGDDAVVALVDRGLVFCSGVLIAPRVVLTAAHCLDPVLAPDPTTLEVVFGPLVSDPDAVRAIVDTAIHPDWDRGSYDNDIGVALLDQPAPIPAAPANLAGLNDDSVGDVVRLVGYGATRPDTPRSSGIKRVGTSRLSLLGARTFGFANDPSQTCNGDSGGPAFLDRGNGELVAGITSYGDADCAVIGVSTRVDPYSSGFLLPNLTRWATPGGCGADGVCLACEPRDPDCLDRCQADDVCQPEGCVPEDPDCALSCRGGNGCIPNCDPVDPDCEPPLVLVGGPCRAAADCLTRLCVASPDDDHGLICSRQCGSSDDCPHPAGRDMRCLDGLCVYDGPSPGAPGWPCQGSGQCRAALCVFGRGDTGICARQCGEDDACPFRFACESVENARLCLPDDGCGLHVAPERRGAVWPLLVALLLLVGYSRKRP